MQLAAEQAAKPVTVAISARRRVCNRGCHRNAHPQAGKMGYVGP
ncbi:hypothetical protein [Thermanaerothrix daxensis]|nr:hypothetical protein [Thermanaerothrix daxensis]